MLTKHLLVVRFGDSSLSIETHVAQMGICEVLNGQCDTGDPTLHNDQEMRKCATEGNDYGVISDSLDGVPIKDLNKYRVDSGYTLYRASTFEPII